MKRMAFMKVIVVAAVLSISGSQVRAQCDPTCQGDFNLDGRVTVDEIITAVNNALQGCGDTAEQGCIASGGSVTTGLCCTGGPAFPNTCGIGPCGCAPQFSSEVSICDCGSGKCFDADQRRCVTR